MGNKASRAFSEAEVGTGTLTGRMGKCICPAVVTTAAQKLVFKAQYMKPSEIQDADGNVMYTLSSSRSGMTKVTITVNDSAGKLICLGVFKDGITKGKFRVLRPAPAFKGQPPDSTTSAEDAPLYPFAVAEITSGWGITATAKYSVTKGDEEGQPVLFPLYEAKKLSAMAFLARRRCLPPPPSPPPPATAAPPCA